MLQNELSRNLPAEFLAQFPGGAEIAFSVIPAIPTLPEPLKDDVQAIFATGISRIWQVMAGIAAAGFLVSLFMKGLPLHTEVDEKWSLPDQKSDKLQKPGVVIEENLNTQTVRLEVKFIHTHEPSDDLLGYPISVPATVVAPSEAP